MQLLSRAGEALLQELGEELVLGEMNSLPLSLIILQRTQSQALHSTVGG